MSWVPSSLRATTLPVFLSLIGLLAMPIVATAQDTADYFRQNCKSCHNIGGGPLTGPDLKDLTQRNPDREWLINFINDPGGVLASGDPYATKLKSEFNNVPMPQGPKMSRDRAEKLLDLIEAESKLESSQFKGTKISMDPFTDSDRKRGREIFLGHHSLQNGGTACIACHSMHDTPALGGGRLGPDLTNIFGTYKTRVALSAWLSAPATPTMAPAFKDHGLKDDEIHALVAYFESSAAEQPANAAVSQMVFLLSGLAGAAALVFLFDVLWKRRFHGVRRPLVESIPTRGES